uniref:Uncharacterized protein n=1 Tax=Hyaloperonospora arabidopsidis (strain Emoy2) TaxID=559515 RepID=M4B9K2_HYAAE
MGDNTCPRNEFTSSAEVSSIFIPSSLDCSRFYQLRSALLDLTLPFLWGHDLDDHPVAKLCALHLCAVLQIWHDTRQRSVLLTTTGRQTDYLRLRAKFFSYSSAWDTEIVKSETATFLKCKTG